MSTTVPDWQRDIGLFGKAHAGKALLQIADTLLPYLGLWALMAVLLRRGVPYVAVLPLVILAAAFLVRLFILFHDCCHGSFFASSRANWLVGSFLGVLAFTPFGHWRKCHNLHHATSGNLDRRGYGDMWLMSLSEYRAAPRRTRFAYRFYRNPFVMLLLGPIAIICLVQRLPNRAAGLAGLPSVLFTDAALVAVAIAGSLLMGLSTFLLIQVPVIVIAGSIGIWLFFVQHNFEGTWWARRADWDFRKAAFKGSSYYRLPAVLKWLSGNIGLHHIHHLRPKIPNYNLTPAFDAIPGLREVEPLTIRRSLRSLRLDLWDEEHGRMVGFAAARAPAPTAR